MLTSRERINRALHHQEVDTIPIDFGGTSVTGIHASSVYRLRQLFQLDPPATPIKIIDPYQMLGEIKPDLLDLLCADTVALGGTKNFFGFNNENWKPWTLFDGTPVLVPENFNTKPEPSGDILLYPEGDESLGPSGRMPKGGWYFDAIIRQHPLTEASMNVEDNLEEYQEISEGEFNHFVDEANRLYSETDKAIVAYFGGTDFGNVALVPAPWLRNPKGIRDIQEWYVKNITHPKHIYEIFERQCDIAIKNLARLHNKIGEKVSVAFVVGNDFGTQNSLFISLNTYRNLYKPFHKKINDWIHQNTTWKTFIHSDGAIRSLIDDLIEAGFDILNPLQVSAAGMDPKGIKAEFGDRLSFWGGGIDTQKTLPYGSPEDVRKEIRERIQLLSQKGGFVFATIHNLQPLVPDENLVALVETLHEFRK